MAKEQGRVCSLQFHRASHWFNACCLLPPCLHLLYPPQVSFPFSGQQHEVHSLRSAEEAGLIALALAMKAAEELQQALDALPPAPGTSRPSFCPPLTATLDVPGLAPTSFRQLVEELQACVDWRNDSRAWGSRMPSNAAHEAAMAGHPAVLRVLLAAAPEAALDTVEDQNEGMYENMQA
ncbi:hypothetical protein ABPG75_012863 [Micractinium tetrahymenae]